MPYPIADFHCDTILNIVYRGLNFAQHNSQGHLDLPRLLEADVRLQCFAVFCDPRHGQEGMLRQTLRLLHAAREEILALPQVKPVLCGSDLGNLKKGQVAALLAVEGADFIGQDLFLLHTVYNMGVRLITLTWNGRNSLADGVGVGGSAGGLTATGKAAVEEMQQLGIIVDVSHLAEKGFWDVCNLTRRPVVASHSNARAVCDHPRNLTDDQIRELARQKGLIGINLCPEFVASDAAEQTINKVVRHMQHIAEIAGTTEIICLGCDLDGIRSLPQGIQDVTHLPAIVEACLEAGFSSAETEGMAWANLARYLKAHLE